MNKKTIDDVEAVRQLVQLSKGVSPDLRDDVQRMVATHLRGLMEDIVDEPLYFKHEHCTADLDVLVTMGLATVIYITDSDKTYAALPTMLPLLNRLSQIDLRQIDMSI